MSRVITFSTVFPSYHPKAGQPTHFVEKIINSLGLPEYKRMTAHDLLSEHINPTKEEFLNGSCNPLFDHKPKYHTVRAGHRWKAGDFFSPRIWSGKPYRSKQITFAPDIQIMKTWNFAFLSTGIYRVGTRQYDGEVESHHELLELIAKNDGLTKDEFLQWFRYPRVFYGQIICWSEAINY